MSGPQIAYAIALAALFAWRGPSFTALVLLGNMGAALAGCYAFDAGLIERADTTLAMMLFDFIAASTLLTQPGLPRVIAAGYALTIPLYSLPIVFGISESTTFAIVISIGFVQLMVAGIGPLGSDGGGGGSRVSSLSVSVGASAGNRGLARGMDQGGLAQGASLLSPDRRGLN